MVKLIVTKEINEIVNNINSLNKLVKLGEEEHIKKQGWFDLQKVKDTRKAQFDLLTSKLITPEIKSKTYTVKTKSGTSFTGTIVGNVKVYGKSLRVTLLNSNDKQTHTVEINK